jgi:hypothetical protein
MSAIRAIRRRLRAIRRLAEAAPTRLIELPRLLRRPAFGSADWLVHKEVKYGGYVTNVARRRLAHKTSARLSNLRLAG